MTALGFDTSNYTTSTAVTGADFLKSQRRILPVKPGERGLRQSDALFAHVKALPELYETLMQEVDPKRLSAVGVSTRPRAVEGSYMPVFLAGEGFARAAAASLSLPLYRFSHQDGHLMAGIYSGAFWELLENPFLAVHLSGGTTEILRIEYQNGAFRTEILGGTKDISAGQLIDRIGVRLGMQFPCGKELDALSETCDRTVNTKISVTGIQMNFSGLETKLSGMIGTEMPEVLARSALLAVAKTLSCALTNAVLETHCRRILLVGGVASNSFLRNFLPEHTDAELFFSEPAYATDNAVGIAELARRMEMREY